jgi:pimeloyl-ACP methyl ester carboxylesterase
MKLLDVYHRSIQDFSQLLFMKGWTKSSLLFPALFGEPYESLSAGLRDLFGWQSSLAKHGFFDAGDPKSLNGLKVTLQSQKDSPLTPVLLFHGLFSTPAIFIPWASELEKAVKDKKIGYVITTQLPNNLDERMRTVRSITQKVNDIYKSVNGPQRVNIIGHSLGGYAGHLLADVKNEIKDPLGVVRRWHGSEPNDQVEKVISIAAPTWLCCQGQHDETTHVEPHKEDIYPWKVYTTKNVKKSYTSDQINTIQKVHKNIFDIIATQDAISPIVSPLPEKQIYYVKHRHLGAITSQKVCQLAISILAVAA